MKRGRLDQLDEPRPKAPTGRVDAETAGALDRDYRDPCDRMLVAHCLNRKLTLVTADPMLRVRRDIAVL